MHLNAVFLMISQQTLKLTSAVLAERKHVGRLITLTRRISTNGGNEQENCVNLKSKTQILQMLESLRKQRVHGNRDDMVHATYLCWRLGLTNEFVDVADEWFRQSRPIFDQLPYFKVSSDLCNLGKCNEYSRGRLSTLTGCKAIEYFVDRLLHIGFSKFHAKDINAALMGLRNFHEYTLEAETKSEMKSLSARFTEKLVVYLRRKRPIDQDWRYILGQTAPMLLEFIKQTGLSSIKPDSFQFICQLVKLGMDEYATNAEPFVEFDFMMNLMNTADAFIRDRIDPDTIVEGFVDSWFNADDRFLRCFIDGSSTNDGLSLLYLSCRPNMARHYNRLSRFWSQLDDWDAVVRRSLNDVSSISSKPQDVHRHVTSFLYNISRLAQANAEVQRNDTLTEYWALLEKALISIDVRQFSPMSQMRAITGFRNFRLSLSRDRSPSDEYYLFLRRWCVFCRLESTQGQDTLASEVAAAMLLSLKKMKLTSPPPLYVLEELLRLFYEKMDDINITILGRLLAYVSDALLCFSYDPGRLRQNFRSRVSNNDVGSPTFWRDFFSRIELVLQLPLTDSDEQLKQTAYLLTVTASVVKRFKRIDEFRSIHNLYSDKVAQMIDYLLPKQLFNINQFLQYIEDEKNIIVDSDLRKKLQDMCSLHKTQTEFPSVAPRSSSICVRIGGT